MIFNVMIYAGILASLQKHYVSENIYLIYDNRTVKELSTHFYLHSLYREILKKTTVTISVLTMQEIQEVLQEEKNVKEVLSDRPLAAFIVDNVALISKEIGEIIVKKSLTATKWILFLSPEQVIEDIFINVYVPYYCQFLTITPTEIEGSKEHLVKEIYQVSIDHQLQVYDFGLWNDKKGFRRTSSGEFYVRRNNLDDLVVDVTTITNYPTVRLDNDKHPTSINGGYFGHVWNILQATLNFTSRYTVPIDKAWGSVDSEGRWNGMIGELSRGETMVAVSEFTMSSTRMDVVNYAAPLMFTSYAIVIKRPTKGGIKWKGFLAPFEPEIWWCLAGAVVTIPLLLITMLHISRHYDKQNYHKGRKNASDMFLDVFKTFCQQGVDVDPRFRPSRIVFLVMYATTVVLLACYSAALISFLTVQTFSLPFSNIDEFLEDGSYTLGVSTKSAAWDLLSNSSNKVFQKIYKNLMEPAYKQAPTNTEGLYRVCQEPKYAYFIPSKIANAFTAGQTCQLEIIKTGLKSTLAMTMSKNCPYAGLFNYKIQQMREVGVLYRLQKNNWPPLADKEQTVWQSVTIIDVVPILTFLSSAMILSIIILFFERHSPAIWEVIKLYKKKFIRYWY